MRFRFFWQKEELPPGPQQTAAKRAETSVEPEKLLPEGLSDQQKRRIFFGVAAVIAVIILANLLGPNAAAPVAKSQQPGAAALQTGPTPAQMAEFQENLRQTERQFREVEAAKQKALADAPQGSPITQEDLQNAEALREAREQRKRFEEQRSGPSTGGASQRQQLEAERAQQAFKSLFADNLVRQEGVSATAQPPVPSQAAATTPSAVPEPQPRPDVPAANTQRKSLDFNPAKHPTFWLPEGSILEAVLTNRLDGDEPGPVNAMITTDVYLPGTRLLLIPAGARVLGEASKVSAFGQQRLAVAFHRLLVPGLAQYAIPLEQPVPGLAQAGEVGLHDKVNNHYASIFGASLAIGAIGGLAQIGNSGSALSDNPSAEFRNGVSQSMAQSSDRVLDKFLNRMPTITIREGTRIKILLTEDLAVPAYSSMTQGAF